MIQSHIEIIFFFFYVSYIADDSASSTLNYGRLKNLWILIK